VSPDTNDEAYNQIVDVAAGDLDDVAAIGRPLRSNAA
jgi:hypothetical protein